MFFSICKNLFTIARFLDVKIIILFEANANEYIFLKSHSLNYKLYNHFFKYSFIAIYDFLNKFPFFPNLHSNFDLYKKINLTFNIETYWMIF